MLEGVFETRGTVHSIELPLQRRQAPGPLEWLPRRRWPDLNFADLKLQFPPAGKPEHANQGVV